MSWLVLAPLALSAVLVAVAGLAIWWDEGATWIDGFVYAAVPLSMVVLPGLAVWAAISG